MSIFFRFPSKPRLLLPPPRPTPRPPPPWPFLVFVVCCVLFVCNLIYVICRMLYVCYIMLYYIFLYFIVCCCFVNVLLTFAVCPPPPPTVHFAPPPPRSSSISHMTMIICPPPSPSISDTRGWWRWSASTRLCLGCEARHTHRHSLNLGPETESSRSPTQQTLRRLHSTYPPNGCTRPGGVVSSTSRHKLHSDHEAYADWTQILFSMRRSCLISRSVSRHDPVNFQHDPTESTNFQHDLIDPINFQHDSI